MLATDPDADRVGIAMKCPDGSYELVSGNEVGVLLLITYVQDVSRKVQCLKSSSSKIHCFHTAC